MKLNRNFRIGSLITVGVVFVVGAIVADAVSKPMDISLQTHIKVCKKSDKGWEVVDELGPATLNFQASLADLANGKQLGTNFTWSTKSKNGVAYSARLLQPAKISYNPVTGQFEGDVKLDCSWNGKKSIVTGHLTTENVSGPNGGVSGRRAHGILGNEPITVTLVSVNDLLLPGETTPLKLVCEEVYKLTPKG